MDKFRRFGGWLFSNLGNIALLMGWFVSLGFFPTLLALGQGATPAQYGVGAVAGLLSFWLIRALSARASLWRVERSVAERLSSDSSPFDPMATVYENKRLFLKDLAPVGRRYVIGKTFINCEIIGPGTALFGTRSDPEKPWPLFKQNLMHDVDCIEIEPGAESHLAIFFPDCDFTRCNFYHMTLLFCARFAGEGWHWITPEQGQPQLIPDQVERRDDE